MKSKHQRATLIILGLILLLGLFLRLWRLDFGQELPYLAHTDEPTQYNPALRIIQTGDFNPHFFNYPSLSIYLHTLVIYVGFGIGRLFGVWSSLADLESIHTAQMAVGVVGTPSLLLLGRATTAVMGTLTVALVFVVSRVLTDRKWLALIAALLLAISLGHVRFSHYMTVDVIATCFAVASVVACTLALTQEKPRYLWLAAIAGGLAASSKYNYAVLAVPVGLVCLLVKSTWADKIKRVFWCGVLFCLAFALTSPYVLLDFEHAIKGIQREIEHYAQGHLGITGSSFVWYLGYLWNENAAVSILGGVGLIVSLIHKKRLAVPLVVFIAIFYFLIGNQNVHFDRNALPLLVLLIVSAVVTLDAVLGWCPKSVREWSVSLAGMRLSALGSALALVVLLPSLWTLPSILQCPAPSGKAQAQAWFDRAIEDPQMRQSLASLKIAGEAYSVYLDPKKYDVEYMSTITKIEQGLLGAKVLKYDIVMFGSGMFARFYQDPDAFAQEIGVYDEFFERVPDQLAFEKRYDPLEFREDGGGQVYVFFLTEKAVRFRDQAESLSNLSAN